METMWNLTSSRIVPIIIYAGHTRKPAEDGSKIKQNKKTMPNTGQQQQLLRQQEMMMSFISGLVYAWWRHQMETFSALLALCVGNSPVPVNSPHKGQWRGALMFSLICARINDWVNNREAGDLRRHRGHYDVNVMWRDMNSSIQFITCKM